jgi:type VI secretion system secreted protein Hcp
MASFIKFDGIDGESKDDRHDKWIDVLSFDWSVHRPGGGATGQSRRRGTAVVNDINVVMEFEKSSPKLLEKNLTGDVNSKVEIESTSNYGGSRETYLRYELKNVLVTSYQISAAGGDDSVPTCVMSLNFEEIKVTYTEWSDDGAKGGNVETTWKVEKGTK